MSAVSPSISPEIYRIAPGFRALSICVKAAPVADEQVGEVVCEAALAGQPDPTSAHGRMYSGPSVQSLSAPPVQQKP